LKTEPEGGINVTPSVLEQLSVTVGAGKFTLAEHFPGSVLTIRLAGQAITGAVLSITVNVIVQVSLLPEASVAVIVTFDVPSSASIPAGGVWVSLIAATELQLSDTLTALRKFGTGALQSAPAEAVIPDGQVNLGASVSLTVTLNVHRAVAPIVSVAVQVTSVTPTAKVDPDGGVQLTAPVLPVVVGGG
jgi:hypothetical protein